MPRKSSKKEAKKQQQAIEPEVWDIRRAYESNNDSPPCMGENCSNQAVACWFSNYNPEEDWNCCEKCQQDDFGGWPPEFVRDQKVTDSKTKADSPSGDVTESNDDKMPEDKEGEAKEDNQSEEKEFLNETTDKVGESGDTEKESNDTPTKDVEQENSNDDMEIDDKEADNAVAEETEIQGDQEVAEDSKETVSNQEDLEMEEASKKSEEEELLEVSQEEEETWNFIKLFTIKEIRAKKALKCNTDGCKLLACVSYTSSLDRTVWNTCLDCQELDYSGWPEPHEMPQECFDMTDEHKSVLAKFCSEVKNPKMPPSANPVTQTQDVVQSNEEEDEVWNLTKLFSIEELRSSNAMKCNTETCNLFACVTYTSNFGEGWNSCLDCQENDYGGWPEPHEMPRECLSMTDEHKEVLTKLCSVKDAPTMPETVIDEIVESDISMSRTLTPPKLSKPPSTKGKQAPLVTPPPKKPSAQALALHSKWQEAAVALGGKEARIIVAKDEAKKIIFENLKDSFRPMNITEIFNSLKAVVPQPVLKSCLEEMTDSYNDNPFDGDDSDDETSTKAPSKKKDIPSDPYASSLIIKQGRNSNTTLYYVDYNKLRNNGNGLLPDERDELFTASQRSSLEEQQLKTELQQIEDLTKKLLSEPLNEEANNALEIKESELSVLEEKLDSLRAYNVNEGTRKKVNKRIEELTSIWRKRQRICKDFLFAMEDATDGTISMSKCLKGEGQMYIEDDNYAINEARIAAKAAKTRKKLGGKKVIKLQSKNTLTNAQSNSNMKHTESFVGVKLDNSGNISRVHLDDDIDG